MEHKRCEESRQNSLDFKCKKILPGIDKLSSRDAKANQNVNMDEKLEMGNVLASPTPEKTMQPPKSKNKRNTLAMRTIRQLSEDFQNADTITRAADDDPTNNSDADVSISESVPNEILDLQKSEENHLPDKYETIADFFDRMVTSTRLVSLCNKLPSFENISMQVEVLMKRKFLCNHLAQMKYIFPEAIQIEKILTHDEKTLCMKPDMKITLSAAVLEGHPNQSASMFLRKAFRTRLLEFFNAHPEGADIPHALLPEPFSQRNHSILPKLLTVGSSTNLPQTTFGSEHLSHSHFPTNFNKLFSQKIVPESKKTPLLASPIPLMSASENLQCTPSKPLSTPEPLMIETPPQPIPRRLMPTPVNSIPTETSILSQSARRRALIFSSSSISERSESSDSVTMVGATEQYRLGINFRVESVQKEMGAIAKDCKMSKPGFVKRQQMLSRLPGLFDIIRLIFDSANCSSITKQELVYKILLHDCDIIETGEAEEQLKLLEELVPDWICGKMVSSGDFLYCIRKTSDPNSILARLVEAV